MKWRQETTPDRNRSLIVQDLMLNSHVKLSPLVKYLVDHIQFMIRRQTLSFHSFCTRKQIDLESPIRPLFEYVGDIIFHHSRGKSHVLSPSTATPLSQDTLVCTLLTISLRFLHNKLRSDSSSFLINLPTRPSSHK